MKQFNRGAGIHLIGAFLLLSAAAPAWATTYFYLGERGLPADQGWAVVNNGTGSQTISGSDILVVTDTSPFNSFEYGTNHFGVTITSSTAWQSRALVRIEDDVTGTRPIYSQVVADTSTRSAGFGIRYTPDGVGSNLFGFWNDATLSRGSISIPWDASSYYQVVLTKPAGVFVTETIEVFDASGTTLLGSLGFSFAGEDGGATDPFLGFGNVTFGAATGTFKLQWATFGIGEAAPSIPEPSAVALCAVASLLGVARLRKQKR
jgi:hypothetical protein